MVLQISYTERDKQMAVCQQAKSDLDAARERQGKYPCGSKEWQDLEADVLQKSRFYQEQFRVLAHMEG